jgi:hypothetical protein
MGVVEMRGSIFVGSQNGVYSGRNVPVCPLPQVVLYDTACFANTMALPSCFVGFTEGPIPVQYWFLTPVILTTFTPLQRQPSVHFNKFFL